MIKIKLTPVGGYVVGDGELPKGFNPDAFLKAFMHKIIEAQMQGLPELLVTEAQFDAIIDDAPVHTIRSEKKQREYLEDMVNDRL